MSVAKLIPKQMRDQHDANMAPGAGTNGYAIVYNHGTGKFELGTFEAAGSAAAAVAAHVALSDPHTQYALESALGTAAAYNVGTGAGNIVRLDGSAKLPAVDGSQLTNLPGGGSVAGSTTQLIFNDAGAYAGDAGLTYAKAADALTVAGYVVTPAIRPAVDGTSAFQVRTAGGTSVMTVDTTSGEVSLTGTSGALTNNAGGLSQYYTAGLVRQTLFSSNGWYRFGSGWQVIDSALPGWRFDAASHTTAGSDIFSVYHRAAGAGAAAWTQYWQISATGLMAVGSHAPTAIADLAASTTARASLRVRAGTAPTSPNAGDIWYPTSGRLSLYRAATEIFATGVQATGGSATASATWTSTEQDMLQKVYDIARAFGMLS